LKIASGAGLLFRSGNIKHKELNSPHLHVFASSLVVRGNAMEMSSVLRWLNRLDARNNNGRNRRVSLLQYVLLRK
jgi:hypothetical protein